MDLPGLDEATKINSDLKRLGIVDVELMYDAQVGIWGVCQVFRPSGKILLMNTPESYETKPLLMFWIKTSGGRYRVPSEQDLSDIIAIVQRSEVIFNKGNDWLIDKIEAQEKEKYDNNRRHQSERIRSVARPLKRAIRRELT